MNKLEFDAVLIDFYGTIAAGDHQVVERIAARVVAAFSIPMSPSEFAIHWGEVFFAVLNASNHQDFRTLHECEVVSLHDALHKLDVDEVLDPSEFVAELEAYWRNPPLHSDAIEFLSRLKLPVCCVSNADTAALGKAMKTNDLRFTAVISSEDARCYKPEPAIFQRALRTLDVPASRCIHIGDSLHSDIGGAAGMGISTAWVNRAHRIHDIGDHAADFEVSELTELLGLFDRH
ncbi:MAG: HAD family hydrolase [Phycisphaerae bacterium]